MKSHVDQVLITGASGLLGRVLVREFLDNGFRVLAQFHEHPGEEADRVKWFRGDFKTPGGVEAFLDEHRISLVACTHLVNNFGPLRLRESAQLETADFQFHFLANTAVAAGLTFGLLRLAKLEAVVNIGFAQAGRLIPFRTILPYALAKHALWQLTRQCVRLFPDTCFRMVSPVTIRGARWAKPGEPTVTPERVARVVFRAATRTGNSHHRIVRA